MLQPIDGEAAVLAPGANDVGITALVAAAQNILHPKLDAVSVALARKLGLAARAAKSAARPSAGREVAHVGGLFHAHDVQAQIIGLDQSASAADAAAENEELNLVIPVLRLGRRIAQTRLGGAGLSETVAGTLVRASGNGRGGGTGGDQRAALKKIPSREILHQFPPLIPCSFLQVSWFIKQKSVLAGRIATLRGTFRTRSRPRDGSPRSTAWARRSCASGGSSCTPRGSHAPPRRGRHGD